MPTLNFKPPWEEHYTKLQLDMHNLGEVLIKCLPSGPESKGIPGRRRLRTALVTRKKGRDIAKEAERT